MRDSYLLVYAQKLIANNESRVTILDVSGVIRQNPEMKEAIRLIEQTAPNHIALFNQNKIEKDLLADQDLMLISLESWQKVVETPTDWLEESPSTLIIKA